MPINSQAKGKRAERDLAKWWKRKGYPDAERAVKTGTIYTHDAGDLLLECDDFRLCVEVKHHAGGLTDSQILAFGKKLQDQCLQSKSNLGVLVERRDRVSDAGRWWVHMHVRDLAVLELDGARPLAPHASFQPARVSLEHLAHLLRRAGFAYPLGPVASSASSGHAESDTAAGRPQAVGGS